jgi:hypothetical protein
VTDVASAGRLLLHARDPEIQAGLEEVGVSGRLLDPSGDYLAVVVNNAGANKVDFYAERSVRYEARLRSDGSAVGALETRVRNRAPSSGQPAYVIGPFEDVSDAGENVMLMSTYCARGCRFAEGRVDDRPRAFLIEEELGHPVALSVLRVPSRDAAAVSYEWLVPEAWETVGRGGIYRLTVQGQPTSRPTELEVVVRPPPGMRVVGGGPGVRVEDGIAAWRGDPGRVTEIRVEVGPILGGLPIPLP